MAVIYALLDPADYAVRYVGYALDGPKRLESHLQQSLKARGHKAVWIRSLRVRGERPIMVTLEDLDGDVDWRVNERWWIARMRELGCDLTNGTDGGDGGNIPAAHTREVQARRSASNKGKKRSPEFCAHLSAVLLGVRQTPERRARQSVYMTGRPLSIVAREKLSVLDEEKVLTIRYLAMEGVVQSVLAKRFGVTQPTISNVVRRLTWAHIKEGVVPNGNC